MNIVIMGKDGKMNVIGNSHDLPVPRIGERVWVGYYPAPKVLDVAYLYSEKKIVVYVDGLILSEE